MVEVELEFFEGWEEKEERFYWENYEKKIWIWYREGWEIEWDKLIKNILLFYGEELKGWEGGEDEKEIVELKLKGKRFIFDNIIVELIELNELLLLLII